MSSRAAALRSLTSALSAAVMLARAAALRTASSAFSEAVMSSRAAALRSLTTALSTAVMLARAAALRTASVDCADERSKVSTRLLGMNSKCELVKRLLGVRVRDDDRTVTDCDTFRRTGDDTDREGEVR